MTDVLSRLQTADSSAPSLSMAASKSNNYGSLSAGGTTTYPPSGSGSGGNSSAHDAPSDSIRSSSIDEATMRALSSMDVCVHTNERMNDIRY
mgnify:CR=1 FL=1